MHKVKDLLGHLQRSTLERDLTAPEENIRSTSTGTAPLSADPQSAGWFRSFARNGESRFGRRRAAALLLAREDGERGWIGEKGRCRGVDPWPARRSAAMASICAAAARSARPARRSRPPLRRSEPPPRRWRRSARRVYPAPPICASPIPAADPAATRGAEENT